MTQSAIASEPRIGVRGRLRERGNLTRKGIAGLTLSLTNPTACCMIPLMELTTRQKEKLSRIAEDIGKLVILSHVLGLLISPRLVDLPKIILGIILSIALFIFALEIDKED